MDKAHRESDRILKELEKRVRAEYEQAAKKIEEDALEHLKQFEADDKKMTEKLSKGEITEKDYLAWRQKEMMTGDRYTAMQDVLERDFARADQIAMAMVDDTLPSVFALNVNYGAFEVEKGALVNTSFTLYDTDTVKNLMKDQPRLLPVPRVDIPKDKVWHRQKIASAMTQGILLGEAIPKIAERLRDITDMDANASVRNARTMITCAENCGRQHGYERAVGMGIKMKKVWVSTLDHRTRASHVSLDGEAVDVDEEFPNGLMYPGDEDGDAAEVYNCRCTLIGAVEGTELAEGLGNVARWDNLEGMSYEEWKETRGLPNGEFPRRVVNGVDISSTWARRPGRFAFEVEDVMSAQGFDGRPRVVSAEEFERAVQAANGGEGFIAQRTYSAPTQEILDAYRQQLYEGHWYVDCSTGGAQYGQGMYCAADYTGHLSDGIKSEMAHYKSLYVMDLRDTKIPFETRFKAAKSALAIRGYTDRESLEWARAYIELDKEKAHSLMESISEERRSDINMILKTEVPQLSHTETMTLDPSARIVTYADLLREKDNEGSEGRFFAERVKKAGFTEDEMAIAVGRLGYHFQDDSGGLFSDDEFDRLMRRYDAMDDMDADAYDVLEGGFFKKWGDDYAVQRELKAYRKEAEALKKMDDGAYAALKGYDAINAEGHGQSESYTIVLNRTKVIIKEEG